MKTLFVITGPTAVGKTELCLQVAQHFGIPIINADSRQIYRELKIGTAAPTNEQLRQVRHYFVGSLSIDDYYSASMYEQQVLALLDELFLTSDYALLSGGSMMYIDAVCNGIDDIPTVDEETRAKLKQRLEDEGLATLCEELRRLDPEHYAIVDKQNPRRVVHALEICYMTGKPYTSFRTNEKKERPFRIVKIAVTRLREELYQRINTRVDQMINDGLVDEAKALYHRRGLNALNTVGYKEMFNFLDGVWTFEEAIERAKRELKETSVPYGYRKLDEKIITRVYKIPENEIIHESQESNAEEIKQNIVNENYSSNSKYENKKVYKSYDSGNTDPFPEEGTIYNYNTITKNHGYYDGYPIYNNSSSYRSQYRQSNINNTRNEEGNEYGNTYSLFNGGKIENYFENQISRDGQYLVSMTLSKKILDDEDNNDIGQDRYRNRFFRKEIEIDENDGDQVIYGDNNKINKDNYSPITNERKVSRHYIRENHPRSNFNKITNSKVHSFQFLAKSKPGEFNYYKK